MKAPNPHAVGPPAPYRFARADFAIALSLWVACVALLLQTSSMGYTRDESFYFRHSVTYVRWISGFLGKGEPAKWTSKDSVYRYWHSTGNNMEHPPLIKVLFGLSWRTFGQKQRRIGAPFKHGKYGLVIPLLANAEELGLKVGDRLLVSHPKPVSAADGDRPERLAGGTLVSAKPRALIKLDGDPLTPASFHRVCDQRIDSETKRPLTIGGCTAQNDGPLALLREDLSMRAPAMVFSGLLIALVFLFGVELFGRIPAFFGALILFFTPRFFFHSHLTCFDVPIATLVFATQYAFWRSESRRTWALGAAVLWGLALLTKHNALLVPVGLVLYWLTAHWREYRLALPDSSALRLFGPQRAPRWRSAIAIALGIATLVGGALLLGLKGAIAASLLLAIAYGLRLRLPSIPLAFLLMPPIGFTMLVLFWPALWYDTLANLEWYLNFHLKHVHYSQQYFGEVLGVPPFPISFPFVMTLTTVPEALVVLSGTGLALFYLPWQRLSAWLSRDEPQSAKVRSLLALVPLSPRARWFIAINGLIPIAVIAMPSSPIFGGVKHWFPTMPFVSLIAAGGFAFIWKLAERGLPIKSSLQRSAIALLCCLLLLTPPLRASLHNVSTGTSYYNGFLGGVSGAASRRMHRQFWGYAVRGALPWLNRRARKNARVWFHNATWGAITMYKQVGLLRHDIQNAALQQAEIAMFFHQRAFEPFYNEVQRAFGTKTPAHQITIDGVPVLSVFVRKGR